MAINRSMTRSTSAVSGIISKAVVVTPGMVELGARQEEENTRFGAAAAAQLHVHPNTVRYRVRRIETMLTTSLADPDVRLLLSLGLRATERIS